MNLESIQNCVAILKKVRRQKHDLLDAGIRDELNFVIEQLESSLTEEVRTDNRVDAERLLSLIARILEVSTNIGEFVSMFWK